MLVLCGFFDGFEFDVEGDVCAFEEGDGISVVRCEIVEHCPEGVGSGIREGVSIFAIDIGEDYFTGFVA